MDKKLRCKECGSSQTRFRLSSGERVCYTCGHIEAIKEDDEVEVQEEDKE